MRGEGEPPSIVHACVGMRVSALLAWLSVPRRPSGQATPARGSCASGVRAKQPWRPRSQQADLGQAPQVTRRVWSVPMRRLGGQRCLHGAARRRRPVCPGGKGGARPTPVQRQHRQSAHATSATGPPIRQRKAGDKTQTRRGKGPLGSVRLPVLVPSPQHSSAERSLCSCARHRSGAHASDLARSVRVCMCIEAGSRLLPGRHIRCWRCGLASRPTHRPAARKRCAGRSQGTEANARAGAPHKALERCPRRTQRRGAGSGVAPATRQTAAPRPRARA